MGDEAFAALLPLIVFAVVDRGGGQGTVWASIGALITVGTLFATSTRVAGSPNVLLRGATILFVALGAIGLLFESSDGWLDTNGRAIAAGGYAVIALGSLLSTPMADHYARLKVKRRLWSQPGFTQLTRKSTAICGVALIGVALSFVAATLVKSDSGITVFNWVVPIALCTIAARRSRLAAEDFFEQCPPRLELDALWDFALGTNAKGAAEDL